MLIEILKPFCADTGYDIISDRTIALDYINRAAFEVYKGLEADDLMREVTLVVVNNSQMTLPPYIGMLRGLRHIWPWGLNSEINGFSGDIYEIGSPRYFSNSWKDKWTGWRAKGKVAIHTSISNASVLTLTVPVVESTPIVVTITGATAQSGRISESVTIDALTKTTTNSFAFIESIVCLTNRTYNTTVSDVNGVELALLYNNELKTRYNLIDIARYPWGLFAGCLTNIAEVLYKIKFYPFVNDTDEFGAEGYEEAIRYKAMELWSTPQTDREQEALAFRMASTQAVNNNMIGEEGGEQKKIINAPTKAYSIMTKMRRAGWLNNRNGYSRSFGSWW